MEERELTSYEQALAAPPTTSDGVMGVESMARLISGFRWTGVLCAAAQLNLPDLVAETGTSCAVLAEQTQCQPRALYRLMRALASIGVFAETKGETFVHTDGSRLLRRDAEQSLHGLACMTGMIDVFVWPHLLQSLKTGEAAFPMVFGAGIFDYLKERPAVGETFDRAMAGFTEVVTAAVLDAYDFSSYHHIIDVGGGNGTLLKRILARYPGPRGTIFDLPHVVERARAAIPSALLKDRLDTQSGSFLTSVPAGGDLYTIKIVLCDWRDEDAEAILRSVRAVIGAGRLLIIDAILPDGNRPSFARLSDINMLVTTGSRERTESEFRALLTATGFRVHTIRLVHEWVGLVEASAA